MGGVVVVRPESELARELPLYLSEICVSILGLLPGRWICLWTERGNKGLIFCLLSTNGIVFQVKRTPKKIHHVTHLFCLKSNQMDSTEWNQ